MAQQAEGWPLGLQPLNARIGLAGNRNNAGSISFNTFLTASPSSSTDSSSDLDSESSWSFFHDKSTTLGSLIGVSRILELSRRSLRGVKAEILKNKKGNKSYSSSWLFCLCSKSIPDAENDKDPPSLGHFLAAERRAAIENRRNQGLPVYGPDEFALAQTISEPNSLFVNGGIAPPGSMSPDTEREITLRESGHGNGFGSLAELFSCMC